MLIDSLDHLSNALQSHSPAELRERMEKELKVRGFILCPSVKCKCFKMHDPSKTPHTLCMQENRTMDEAAHIESIITALENQYSGLTIPMACFL